MQETSTESDESNPEEEQGFTEFRPTFYRRNAITTEFLELYKGFPCLWDPTHENFSNFPIREECHTKVRDIMKKKFDMHLSERGIEAAFKKIHEQFSTISKKKSIPGRKLPTVVEEYLDKCSFLTKLNDSPVEVYNRAASSRNLVFTKVNDVTNAFIETYKRFPALYDPNHADNAINAKRKPVYQEMLHILKNEYNIIFSLDDLYKSMYGLRSWYYRTQKRIKSKGMKAICEAQKIYFERSGFLPPRISKTKRPCEVCGQVCLSELALKNHMYKKHKQGELPFKCGDCDRAFDQRSSLVMHKQRYHVGKVHKCEYCERPFAVPVDLQRHIRTHTGERPFVCELCGKTFPRKAQLSAHKTSVHVKARAFKCTMCPKDFFRNRDLKDHIKAHLNIRDKICPTCGKGFTNCHSLSRHRQIHSEVKKFVCKLCDARFHQFVGLNSHMKRTHNIVKNKSENQ